MPRSFKRRLASLALWRRAWRCWCGRQLFQRSATIARSAVRANEVLLDEQAQRTSLLDGRITWGIAFDVHIVVVPEMYAEALLQFELTPEFFPQNVLSHFK